MAAKARLEGTMGWNDSEFVNGVKRTEQYAKTVSGRIGNLFQFRGERRAAKGTGLFATQILTAQSGIDVLEASVLGLSNVFKVGFGATVGVIAGVAVFNKLKGSVEATRKAYEDLSVDLNKPIDVQSRLGVEGIGEQIESLKKKKDALFTQDTSTTSQFIKLFQGKIFGNVKDTSREALDKAFTENEALQKAQGKAALRGVSADEISGRVSEREGDIAKIRANADENRAKIELTPRFEPGRADKLEAVNRGEALALDLATKKYDKRQQELDLEAKVLSIHREGLTQEQESLKVLNARIAALQTQLNTPGTTKEQKSVIGGQIAAAKNLQREAQFNAADMSPEAVQARNKAQLQALRVQSFNKSMDQSENPNREAYGSIVSGIGAVGPQKPRGTDWGALFPKEPGLPPGKNWAVEQLKAGRNNEQSIYQTNPYFQDLRNGAKPSGAVADFGSGNFMDVKSNVPGLGSWSPTGRKFGDEPKNNESAGAQSGLAELAGKLDLLVQRFDQYWGK